VIDHYWWVCIELSIAIIAMAIFLCETRDASRRQLTQTPTWLICVTGIVSIVFLAMALSHFGLL